MEDNNYPEVLFPGDQTPVRLEQRCYQVITVWNSGRHETVIKESLVIHVDKKNRHFTVRCEQGCEERIKVLGSCGYNSSYYGSYATAQAAWKESLQKTLAEKQKGLKSLQDEIAWLSFEISENKPKVVK